MRARVGESAQLRCGGVIKAYASVDEAREIRSRMVEPKRWKVFRMHRLAPLVELPAWRPMWPGAPDERTRLKEQAGVDEGRSGYLDPEKDYDAPAGPGGTYDRPLTGRWEWLVKVRGDGSHRNTLNSGVCATIDEARAACEERLRELGYRVAKS